MLTSLSHRQLEGELMDDPAIDRQAHLDALRGLKRINVVSRTATALWPAIRRIVKARPGRTLTLLDVATGGGDVAIALAQHARREGLNLRVEGCDISPTALFFAEEQALRAGAGVNFFTLDALSDPLPSHYDIVVSTLFLHHLSDDRIVALLRSLRDVASHVVISDLLRTRTGYGLAYLGTRLLSLSRVVHEDGLRSVRAALTLKEAQALVNEAGMSDAHFERHWPSRFLMTWSHREAAADFRGQEAGS